MMNPFKRISWLDIEIYELRAGGSIRIVDDKVQRRTADDGSQEYWLKNLKDSLEAQEFEDIFIGSDGKQKLKCFSPTKGVYWPIKLIVTKTRELTEIELKQIQDSGVVTPEDELKLMNIKDEEKREEEKNIIIDINRHKKEKEIYQKIYKAYMETVIDTETLNHAIYKIQKNQLRLQTSKGISPTLILTVALIGLAVFIILASWAEYTYFQKPAMEFWNEQAPKILEASQRVACNSPVQAPVQPVPVG
jgi:hypothetical protein